MAHRHAYIAILLFAGLATLGLLRWPNDASAHGTIPIMVSLSFGVVEAEVPVDTATVGDALLRLAIDTESAIVSPPPSAALTPNLTITITPVRTVQVLDGAESPYDLVSAATTVGDALVTAGITLAPLDTVHPKRTASLVAGTEIMITRIEEVERTETIVVPYHMLVAADAAMLWGNEKVVVVGENGAAEEDVLLRFVNGELTNRTVLAYRLLHPPVHKEVRRGTKIVIDEIYEGNGSWYAYKHCDCAASVRYPRGTWLRVTNLLNGKQVIVITNDWGPDPSVHPDRIIDLDAVPFKRLYPLWKGVIPVRVEHLVTSE